jgi:membrane protein implicated in regulation of membrane protease activity
MFALMTAPGVQPFAIAGLVLLGLLAIEVASMMFGSPLSSMMDAAFDVDAPDIDVDADHGVDLGSPGGDGAFGSIFEWLNKGRVPLLILIMAALASFSVSGLVFQILAIHTFVALPTLVAVPLALLATIPLTRWTSRAVAMIMPRDESYAVTNGDLIGRTGIVTLGPVEATAAGRAKIQDQYGNWHFPRVCSARSDLVIAQGASVLVVDQTGNELKVIPAEGRLDGIAGSPAKTGDGLAIRR